MKIYWVYSGRYDARENRAPGGSPTPPGVARAALPQPDRPLKDPWRMSGVASRREDWAGQPEAAQRRTEEHERNAPHDPMA